MSTVEAILQGDASQNPIDYLIQTPDGGSFHLGFQSEIVEVWKDQSSRSGIAVDLDEIARELGEEIISQQPTDEELRAGYTVPFDNGFATPVEALHNIQNSRNDLSVDKRSRRRRLRRS